MSEMTFFLILFGILCFTLAVICCTYFSSLRCLGEDLGRSQVDRETERQDYLRLVSQVLEQKSVPQVEQTRLAQLHTQERAQAYADTLNSKRPPVQTQPEDNGPMPLVNTDPDGLVAPYG